MKSDTVTGKWNLEKGSLQANTSGAMDSQRPDAVLDPVANTDASDRFPAYIRAIQQGKALPGQITPLAGWIIRSALAILSVYFRIRMGAWGSGKNKRGQKADTYSRYEELAAGYEQNHTRTMNGRDLWWRREVAYHAAFFLKQRFRAKPSEMPLLVDLCTGTGLSLEEMFRVFDLERVHVKAIGVDINEAMLQRAKNETLVRIQNTNWAVSGVREITFLRGDATKLTSAKKPSGDWITFEENSVACITNILGACGLADSLQCFREQLRVLETGGIAIALDVHRPIPSLTPSWPFNKYKWWPVFEQMAWDIVTVPLVLNEYWAWEDPTLSFHTVPLLTVQSERDGKHYGFELLLRLLRTETWWFGLLVIPNATMILRKIEITAEEARARESLLADVIGEVGRNRTSPNQR